MSYLIWSILNGLFVEGLIFISVNIFLILVLLLIWRKSSKWFTRLTALGIIASILIFGNIVYETAVHTYHFNTLEAVTKNIAKPQNIKNTKIQIHDMYNAIIHNDTNQLNKIEKYLYENITSRNEYENFSFKNELLRKLYLKQIVKFAPHTKNIHFKTYLHGNRADFAYMVLIDHLISIRQYDECKLLIRHLLHHARHNLNADTTQTLNRLLLRLMCI